MVEAQNRGQGIHPDEFLRAPVPRKVKAGHGGERIEKYLLDLFLRQLPESEQDQLTSCAVPRFLDVAILQAILELPGEEARDRWYRYRHLTFMRAIDNERIVFHPIVRELLLGRLLPGREPESRYSRLHSRLREHFHQRAGKQGAAFPQGIVDWQAQIEEALRRQKQLVQSWQSLSKTTEQAASSTTVPAEEPLLSRPWRFVGLALVVGATAGLVWRYKRFRKAVFEVLARELI